MVVTVPGIVNSISVNAFGSPAMGVYPEMQVNVNGVVQGDWFVNGGNVSYVVSSLSDTHFYFADHLGTVSLIVNANGSIESKSEFDPYGVEVDGNGWDANHYKFTGKERDIESGLDYFGARYYGSTMGRFLSPDWADKPEAVPYSDLSDPQSLNLYGYVRNNPLKTVDSDGHDGEDACCDLGPAIEEINAVAKPLITSAVGALEEGTTLTLGSLGAGAALMLSTKSTNDPTEDAWVNSKGQKSDTVPSDGGVRSSTNDLFENTLENRLRRSQGKPPIGRDGHPLELHSPDQTHTDQSVTMTRTDHRLGDNFKKNHANTGQNPSRIDRNKVNAARRRFWKKHPDEIPPPPKP
jgi:RHS repeat-associated protein